MSGNDSGFATPQEAENAFYRAFERGDISSMMAVWSEDDTTVCIHPGGPRIEGLHDIRESWEQIFAVDNDLKFILTDNQYTRDALLSIHQVRESIEIDGVLQGTVLATNIYQFVDGSWRMLLHHASADPLGTIESPEGETLH
ncbi:MAG: nuclear transport factor 2 family protein [Pseudomonadota bacterium]|nr:nuclear transport factor 2 family protein [Pseudomonadota bacterium]